MNVDIGIFKGRDDFCGFFSGSLFRLKFVCALTFDFFLSSFRFLKINSTIEHQMCKGHEKHDGLLVSTVELNFQISQQKKLSY